MIHVGQDLDAVIRDFDDTDIGFNRAERIISRFCSGFGNGIEQVLLPTFGSPTMPISRLVLMGEQSFL
jgi:hypothetical protein